MKNRLNTWWFWLLLLALAFVAWSGITAAATIDSACGRDAPKTWQWAPPHWECQARF